MTLTSLEDQVVRMLLFGEDEFLTVLRQQLQQALVSSREMTGVGFFVNFIVPPEAPRVFGNKNFELTDVNGTAENVKDGLGFVLFVRDGELTMLEGYTYNEPWPDEFNGLVLTYSGGKSRNLDDVRKNISAD